LARFIVDDPPPSLHDHYSRFLATTEQSAPLRRIGTFGLAVGAAWALFNKRAGLKLDVKTASSDALDAVKAKAGRICPQVCDAGYRADGDHCVKITCRVGYSPNDDGECEKSETKKPTAKRDEPKAKKGQADRAKLDAAPAKPQASGVVCSQQGCQEIPKNCHRVSNSFAGSDFAGRDNVVCN
jgi:hypothetical protein